MNGLPTFIYVAKAACASDDVLFIVREPNTVRETYTAVVKYPLSHMLFEGEMPFEQRSCSEFDLSVISFRAFIKGLMEGDAKYTSILSDVERFANDCRNFRQYRDNEQIVDGCIGKARVTTTLDMIMQLKKINKLKSFALRYLFEIEYGIKQVNLLEFLNVTCSND